MFAVFPLKTCPHLKLLRPGEAPKSKLSYICMENVKAFVFAKILVCI